MQIMKIITIVIIVLFSFSCEKSIEGTHYEAFSFPKIKVNYNDRPLHHDSLTMINTDSLTEQHSGFIIGKYSTQVSNIQLSYFNPDKISEFDTVLNTEVYQSDGLQIKLDTSQFIVDPWHYNLHNDKTAFYPLVLLNETSTEKRITTISNRVFLLQEIYYEPYFNWVAINNPLIFNMCGDSESNIVLKTNEYVLLNVPVYTGNDLVKMRVRILNGDNIYVSKPFHTKINLSQIYLPKHLKTLYKRYTRKGSLGQNFAEWLPFLKQ
nr:hypothetical protein [uncultured Brumimicrobium sp.]